MDSRDYVLSGIYFCVLEPRKCAKHKVACQDSQQTTTDDDPMLDQCRPTVCDRLRPSIKPALVQRLVFAGLRSIAHWSGSAYCWKRVQAGTDTMSVKYWASVASAG